MVTDTPNPDPEATALSEIIDWSKDKPAWIRDALRRLNLSYRLEQKDLESLYAICICETIFSNSITIDDVRSAKYATSEVSISKIYNVKNINALAEEQQLTIAEKGITVIYGDNGSGKSGYSRILKNLCRARGQKENLRTNIYKIKQGVPSADIDFKINTSSKSLQWRQGAPSDPALSNVSVFDTRTANVHVGDDNDVAYNPYPLRLLERLAGVAARIQSMINDNISTIQKQTPISLLNLQISKNSQVAKFLLNLSFDATEGEVDALSTIDDSQKARLKALQEDLERDSVKATTRLRSLKERVDKGVAFVKRMVTVGGYTQGESVRGLFLAWRHKEEAAKAAATKLFDKNPIPTLGSETWRNLWEAARKFSEQEAYKEKIFPYIESNVARCVLCQQNLDSASQDRLTEFENFVTNETRRWADLAKKNYDEAVINLEKQYFDTAIIQRAELLFSQDLEQPKVGKLVRRCLVLARWNLRRIIRLHMNDDFSPPRDLVFDYSSLLQVGVSLQERLAILTDPSKVSERTALQNERDELEARRWLSENKLEVKAEIKRKRDIALLQTAKRDTNSKSITDLSTKLADILVTQALRGKFAQEIAALGVSSLAVELVNMKSSHGVPLFRVTLTHKADAKIGEILSEGEHRCIALAAFLAEQATATGNSCIVLDDPVSSLDHHFRDSIAKRLAEEGKRRQMIIFTHDLAFLFLLNSFCEDEKTSINFRSVSRTTDKTGICSVEMPHRAQPVETRIEGLQKHLDNTEQFYGTPKWESIVEDFVTKSRKIWEGAVEDILEPSIKRLANKVDTKGLLKIAKITEADCLSMREAFKRCSGLIHEGSDILNPPLPEPKTLQNEIDFLRGWYSDIKNRQKVVVLV